VLHSASVWPTEATAPVASLDSPRDATLRHEAMRQSTGQATCYCCWRWEVRGMHTQIRLWTQSEQKLQTWDCWLRIAQSMNQSHLWNWNAKLSSWGKYDKFMLRFTCVKNEFCKYCSYIWTFLILVCCLVKISHFYFIISVLFYHISVFDGTQSW